MTHFMTQKFSTAVVVRTGTSSAVDVRTGTTSSAYYGIWTCVLSTQIWGVLALLYVTYGGEI